MQAQAEYLLHCLEQAVNIHEKMLNGNYTRVFRAVLKKFWTQDLTKQYQYGYLRPITQIVQVREQHVRETIREVRRIHIWHSAMDSYAATHSQMLADEQKFIYISSVQTLNVILKSYQGWCMTEREREREREIQRALWYQRDWMMLTSDSQI